MKVEGRTEKGDATRGSARAWKRRFDEIHARYHHRRFVHPDPLEFLYDYSDLRDREIVGLVASALAYGRVAQILRSAAAVLDRMTPSPRRFLDRASRESLRRTFRGFRHRFTTGDHVADMLFAARRAVERHGSLGACFAAGLNGEPDAAIDAMTAFADALTLDHESARFSLVPSPGKGSACKRLSLFLRWMVRQDDVDPGGWVDVPRSLLIVPLDTHMFSLCRTLGFTARKQADLIAALEITAAFRSIAPDDPVRYDFSLTRLGIREGVRPAEYLTDAGGRDGDGLD